VSPLIALIAVLSVAVLVLGIAWLLDPSKRGEPRRDRLDYRRTAVHRWGDEERTRDMR
jgi:hypothetical protein